MVIAQRKKKKKEEEQKKESFKDVITPPPSPFPDQRQTLIPKEEQEPSKPTPTGSPEIIRNQETGKPSGVKLPDGREFLGISPKEIEDLVANYTGKRKTPEGAVEATAVREQAAQEEGLAKIQIQQEAELAKQQELIGLQPQADFLTRLSQAGLIAPTAAGNYIAKQIGRIIGIEVGQKTPEELAQTTTGKILGAPVGFLTTFGVKGISLSTLFSGYSKNIDNLQKDSGALRESSAEILSDVISRKGGVDEGIDATARIETAILLRYADAQDSLRKSPQDIRDGLDLTDSIFKDLNRVTRRRQALERYAITNDPTEIISLLGGIPQE